MDVMMDMQKAHPLVVKMAVMKVEKMAVMKVVILLDLMVVYYEMFQTEIMLELCNCS